MSKHPLQIIIERTNHHEKVAAGTDQRLTVTVTDLPAFISDVMSSMIEFTVDEPDGDQAAGEAAEAFRWMRTNDMGKETQVTFLHVKHSEDDEPVDDQGEETPPV